MGHHHRHDLGVIREQIGPTGALAFLAGVVVFLGLSLWLFGTSRMKLTLGTLVPSAIWLGILYIFLDENSDDNPPDVMGGPASEQDRDASEAGSDDGDLDGEQLTSIDDEVE